MVKRKTEVEVSKILPELSERLSGSKSNVFVGEEEKVSFLLDLVNKTVEKGESNSVLVLGPHGVGKSALVKKVLADASKSKSWSENVVLVQLGGFLLTDDKLALKEITLQLNLENVVGERVFGSFADHLTFLLSSLKTGDKTSKPIIFVLEEFDMFCSHKNQTLLYNLFDTAQSRAVPICVIGLSCQIDVTELLEKRVNSRFSHRHLNMMAHLDLKQYLLVLLRILTLDSSTSDSDAWNAMVSSFLSKADVKKFIEENVFNFDKTISHMKRFFYSVILNLLKSGESELSVHFLKRALADTATSPDFDPVELVIQDLSILEICLLIAVNHIRDIYDNEPFNFEMVYHEMVKFRRRRFSSLPEDRTILFKCWENLLALEFVLPKAGDRTKGQQLEYILDTYHLPQSVLKKSVENYAQCPTEVIQWLNNSVYITK